MRESQTMISHEAQRNCPPISRLRARASQTKESCAFIGGRSHARCLDSQQSRWPVLKVSSTTPLRRLSGSANPIEPAGFATNCQKHMPVLWLLALALLLTGSCGYGVDVPRLPDGTHSLAFGDIRNLSAVGEVDVFAISAIRQRLLLNPRIQIVDYNQADLILDLDIDRVVIRRALGSEISSVIQLTYALRGQLSLRNRIQGTAYLDKAPVSAGASTSIQPTAIEHPSVRELLLRKLAEDLAESVEAQIFYLY